ncbi:hypothetical protein NOF55_13550 [Rhizobiaceae bacterium BDR2-2]|uniref:Membrane protein involved in the export of O-antigen and teichoic acid n=1 Tax=Ectorhizobium quercum TaxID=2965071 RepID=A0AAE3N1E2_9HYPH|nr:hypothetical protein [Ectorhizobium quercum]MCX8998131.1 hypothetical protein [Ectorhizobium quercum]
MLLLPKLTPHDYGFFAFTLVLVQFTFSITNATASTPLSVLLNQNPQGWEGDYHAIRKVNLILSLFSALIVLGSGFYFEIGVAASLLMAAFAWLSAVRWFNRSFEYARHLPRYAALSDVVYSVVLVAGSALLFFWSDVSILFTSLVLNAAALAALVYLVALTPKTKPAVSGGRLRDYLPIWRDQVRWSLVGVTTTEMTVNGHAYLVTFLAGPTAFAPLAIATLCWRPVATMLPSITLIERPVMARQLAEGKLKGARRTVRVFQVTVQAILLINILALVAAWYLFPQQIAGLPYDLTTALTAIGLWFIVIFVRTIRIPESTFIQAAKSFKELARTSMVAAPVSLGVAALLIIFFNPTISILGIIAGEIAMTTGILLLGRKIVRHYEKTA